MARASVPTRTQPYWTDTLSEIALHAATLIASFFQAVTGVGFGMIAGPVVLVVMNDPAAVVISTCMSWLISIVLFPFLRRGTDLGMLARLATGAVIGLPAGLWLLGQADIAELKLMAGIVIGVSTFAMVFGLPGTKKPGLAGDLIFGGLGGLFGGCLAMPGPTAAIRMSGLGHDKAKVRATMVSFFFVVWPMIFMGQWATAGITSQTMWNALGLVPATLAGIVIGNAVAARLSERFFRRLVIGVLVVTSASLLTDAALNGLGGTP